VEELLCAREVIVTYETIRQCHYLWRAVDQDSHVLDILVQRRRDKKAAKKFFRKLLKGGQYVPRVLLTDQLKSYGAAMRFLTKAIRRHGVPEKITIDGSEANAAAIRGYNDLMLSLLGNIFSLRDHSG